MKVIHRLTGVTGELTANGAGVGVHLSDGTTMTYSSLADLVNYWESDNAFPSEGSKYYYIDHLGNIYDSIYKADDSTSQAHYAIGNIFPTAADASEALARIAAFLRLVNQNKLTCKHWSFACHAVKTGQIYGGALQVQAESNTDLAYNLSQLFPEVGHDGE